MDSRKKNIPEQKSGHEEANVLPPTEIVQNPNPRANENVPRTEEHHSEDKKDSGVGSEITDGEDA